MAEDYSLREIFDEFRSETRGSLDRIERKVDTTQERVSKIEVGQAQQVGKLSILVILLGAGATTIGMILGSLVLGGVK